MELMEWDPDLETGNEFMDGQHRAMVERFNELIVANSDYERVITILEHLDEQTLVHFSTEERLMTETGFPQGAAKEHIGVHRQLKARVRDFVLEFRNGELTSPKPLLDFLRVWLREHETIMDRDLAAHIREHTKGAS